MRNALIVGISDYKVAKNPQVLATYALGSCVGICLYDAGSGVGGLSHIMLPDSAQFARQEINRMKFADTALADLVAEMEKMGAQRRRIKAKIAGGARMFQVQEGSSIGSIGERNVASVKHALGVLRIPVLAEDTGSNYGRTVFFSLETGIMRVQALSREVREY